MRFNPKALIVPFPVVFFVTLVAALICFIESVAATETIVQERNVPCVATDIEPATERTVRTHVRCRNSNRPYETAAADIAVARFKQSAELPLRCTLYRHKNEVDCTLHKGG